MNDGYSLTDSSIKKTKAVFVTLIACTAIYLTHAVVALIISVIAASVVTRLLVDKGSASNR